MESDSTPEATQNPSSSTTTGSSGYFLIRWADRFGHAILNGCWRMYQYLQHFALTVRGLRGLKPGQVVKESIATGLEAVPILLLIGFLMGLIMTMRTVAKLEEFGAALYVADLVASTMVRAIGPLLTGILIAGRSSSAFAAEVGTRKINDEISALETMGLDKYQYLFSPKLIATMLVMPFLTLLTSTLGIVGGFSFSVVGDFMSPRAYLHQTFTSLKYYDIISGCSKSIIYGAIIAIVGCVKGSEVERGAPQIGSAARSSVVLSIILIIIADAIFTGVLQWF